MWVCACMFLKCASIRLQPRGIITNSDWSKLAVHDWWTISLFASFSTNKRILFVLDPPLVNALKKRKKGQKKTSQSTIVLFTKYCHIIFFQNLAFRLIYFHLISVFYKENWFLFSPKLPSVSKGGSTITHLFE